MSDASNITYVFFTDPKRYLKSIWISWKALVKILQILTILVMIPPDKYLVSYTYQF